MPVVLINDSMALDDYNCSTNRSETVYQEGKTCNDR